MTVLAIVVGVLGVAAVIVSSAVGFARSFARRDQPEADEPLGVVLLGQDRAGEPPSSTAPGASH